MIDIPVSTTLCRVEFFTDEDVYVVEGKQSPDDDLLRVSTSKSLTDVAGNWDVELIGLHWYKKLKPQDMVVIRMGRPPEKLHLVMMGFIDSIYKRRNVGEGSTVDERVVVSGRDFGKLFLNAEVKWMPQLEDTDFPIDELTMPNAMLHQMKNFMLEDQYQIGEPAKLLENVVDNILPSLLNFKTYYWDGEKKETDVLSLMNYCFERVDGLQIPFKTTMWEFEGSIWNYMRAVQNPPFFELFVDVRSVDEYEDMKASGGTATTTVTETRKREVTRKRDKKHTVVGGDPWGDTLWDLADHYYGDPTRWPEIYEANKDKIDDPHWIFPGQVFVIPGVKEEYTETVEEEVEIERKTVQVHEDAVVVLLFRKTPFDAPNWVDLPTHYIKDELHVLKENLGRDDDDNYNMFYAKPIYKIFREIDYTAVIKPVFNVGNLERHGISMLEVDVEGFMYDDDEEELHSDSLQAGDEFTKTLKYWFENNVNYEKGNITLKGYGGYRIGHRLVKENDNMVYYIERVSQSFQRFGDWTTSLEVTRGRKFDDEQEMEDYENFRDDVESSRVSDDTTDTKDVYHTVVGGDTLWDLAVKYYGDGTRWPEIYKANKDKIDDPHWIFPGQVFLIKDVKK